MEVLRFLKDGKWRNLYYGMLKNRLRKDLNLSDVSNTTEALNNLGLTGDVTSHNHDSRYKAMIDKAKGEMKRWTSGVSDDYTNLNKRLMNVETSINYLEQNAVQKPHFWIGESFYGAPRDYDIWLDTKDCLIRFFKGGKWHAFTAGWKE